MGKHEPCTCGHAYDAHEHHHFSMYCSVKVSADDYCTCLSYRKPKRFLFW